MEIIKGKASPKNYSTGRGGHAVATIVIHTAQGSSEGTNAWFTNPEAHASAHYVISFEGRIVNGVDEANTCWHAGNTHVNQCSIGIELEGFMEKAHFPKPMMDSLAWLIGQICDRYQIPRDRQHIIGHCEVPDPKHHDKFGGANSHQDPGVSFPWGMLMTSLGVITPNITEPVSEPAVASVVAPLAPSTPALDETPEMDGVAPCEVCGEPSDGQYLELTMGPGDNLDGLHDLCANCAEHLTE